MPDWRFVEAGRDIRVACTPRFLTNSADAAIQYAEQGGGLTRVLAYQAADAIKAGRLKIVLAKFEQPPLPIHIVYPTSRLLSAKVRSFIDLVVELSDWQFGNRHRVPDAVQRVALRCRAGAHVAIALGPGSAEQRKTPHRVRDTMPTLLRHHAERRIGARDHGVIRFDNTLRETKRAAGLDDVGLDREPLPDLGAADEIDRHADGHQ